MKALAVILGVLLAAGAAPLSIRRFWLLASPRGME